MLPAFRWVPPRRGAEGRLCPGTEGSAGRGCRPVPAEGRRLLRGSLGPAGASVGLPRAAHAGGGCRGPVRFPPPPAPHRPRGSPPGPGRAAAPDSRSRAAGSAALHRRLPRPRLAGARPFPPIGALGWRGRAGPRQLLCPARREGAGRAGPELGREERGGRPGPFGPRD